VLYLHVGDPLTAVAFDGSPEGHALRVDADGELVGITVVGARELLRTGGDVTITVPARLVVAPDELQAVIDAA
jgi:hypothetical protein